MIKNRIDEVMKDQGRKRAWVIEKYQEVSGLKMTTMMLYNIRKNNRQPVADELFWFAYIFDVSIPKLLINVK